MASGTILLTPSATSGSYVAGKLVWSSTADAAGNCSQLTAELYARKDSTTTILTIPTYGTWNFSLTVAGQTVTGSPVLSILTDWVLVGSLQRTVAHSASGSGSAAISCWVSGPAGTSLAGHRASGSGTAVLDSIPRISQPSLGSASFRLGDPVVIYTNPCSGEFTHTLRYTFSSRSGLIGEKVASQFSWNAPAALAEEIFPTLLEAAEYFRFLCENGAAGN